MHIAELTALARQMQASDIHISEGLPLAFRIHGRLEPAPVQPSAAETRALILGLLVCNLTLKPLVARIRPYDLQEQDFGVYINLLISRQSDFSFPSGHTIASFEAAVVLLKNSKKMGIPALIIAILVSFSRLYLYVHYPSDVLVSVVLGTAFAFAGCALANLIKLPSGKKGRFEKK